MCRPVAGMRGYCCVKNLYKQVRPVSFLLFRRPSSIQWRGVLCTNTLSISRRRNDQLTGWSLFGSVRDFNSAVKAERGCTRSADPHTSGSVASSRYTVRPGSGTFGLSEDSRTEQQEEKKNQAVEPLRERPMMVDICMPRRGGVVVFSSALPPPLPPPLLLLLRFLLPLSQVCLYSLLELVIFPGNKS
jgi:hypothetical protein